MSLKPKQITDLDLAFGRVDGLIPAMREIPEEFKHHRGKWVDLVCRWFFQGLPEGTRFIPADGIDELAAMRHIGAVLRSFEPKHEHKEAAAAYLLSLWFKDVVIPAEERALGQ